ncbi:MAG: hypothetical protein M1834_006136 [Cirrosporium novae-zelandiae]|nr:MAG: hypothetical protein M1834_006136 [Cirrosporium novae-zelandiae]
MATTTITIPPRVSPNVKVQRDLPSPKKELPYKQRENQAKIVFNKTIAGHYRNRENGYSNVGSLLITWENDDMNTRGEVKALQSILRDKFHYATDAFQIPSRRSETALVKKVSDFVNAYDDSDNLIILYYGGHGYVDEEYDGTEVLKISAREEGNGDIGDPGAFFHDVLNLLKRTHSDVLLIVDCCFAARAFTNQELGRRKFELLTSSPANMQSYSPNSDKSFTTLLIKVLESLFQNETYQHGFPTSVLYRRIYHHPDADLDIKPMLFDQSQFDYGKIWLRPQVSVAYNAPLNKPPVSLDLRLNINLTKSDEKLVGLAMNELATALKYLPHVHSIDFQELHAGDETVQKFQEGIQKVTRIKKVVKRLRKVAREAQLRRESEKGGPGLKRPPSFYEVMERQESSAQDWTGSFAKFSDGSTMGVKRSPGQGRRGSEQAKRTQAPIHIRRSSTAMASFSWPIEDRPCRKDIIFRGRRLNDLLNAYLEDGDGSLEVERAKYELALLPLAQRRLIRMKEELLWWVLSLSLSYGIIYIFIPYIKMSQR